MGLNKIKDVETYIYCVLSLSAVVRPMSWMARSLYDPLLCSHPTPLFLLPASTPDRNAAGHDAVNGAPANGGQGGVPLFTGDAVFFDLDRWSVMCSPRNQVHPLFHRFPSNHVMGVPSDDSLFVTLLKTDFNPEAGRSLHESDCNVGPTSHGMYPMIGSLLKCEIPASCSEGLRFKLWDL